MIFYLLFLAVIACDYAVYSFLPTSLGRGVHDSIFVWLRSPFLFPINASIASCAIMFKTKTCFTQYLPFCGESGASFTDVCMLWHKHCREMSPSSSITSKPILLAPGFHPCTHDLSRLCLGFLFFLFLF